MEVLGFRSDSDSSIASIGILDTSIIEEGFTCGIFRVNDLSGVVAGEVQFPGVGDNGGGLDPGVGGRTLMTGTPEGDSISLFPLDVTVKRVSGSRLILALSLSSSVAPALNSAFRRFRLITAGILFTCKGNWKHDSTKKWKETTPV